MRHGLEPRATRDAACSPQHGPHGRLDVEHGNPAIMNPGHAASVVTTIVHRRARQLSPTARLRRRRAAADAQNTHHDSTPRTGQHPPRSEPRRWGYDVIDRKISRLMLTWEFLRRPPATQSIMTTPPIEHEEILPSLRTRVHVDTWESSNSLPPTT
jgi:hypothetical protein